MTATNVQVFSGDLHVSNLVANTTAIFANTFTGRVGIGSMNPGAKLDVIGDVVISSSLEVGTSANLFANTLTGNVGIGTTTPQKTLEIMGPLRVSDGLSNLCDFSLESVNGWLNVTKIMASNAGADDEFGYSCHMAADGNYAIVGAPFEDTGASKAGSAYIFIKSGTGWSQQAQLTASNAGADDEFGKCVALSDDGTYAIVGAHKEDTGADGAGSAYIFIRSGTGWSQQAQLTASNAGASDMFGHSVSINGNGTYAVVGAKYEDTGATNAGAAYVFFRNGGTSWSQQAQLGRSSPASYEYFGESVAISSDGSYIVVGVTHYNVDHYAGGTGVIFIRSGTSWSQQAILPVPGYDGYHNYQSAYLGTSVDISDDGTYAVIGGPQAMPPGQWNNYGIALVFIRSGTSWSLQTFLTANPPQYYSYFGQSVAITSDGDYIMVGQYSSNPGKGFLYSRSGTSWSQKEIISPSDNENGAWMGYSVGIADDATVMLGAPRRPTSDRTGAAYIVSPGVLTTLLCSQNITANGAILSFTGQHTCFPEGQMSQGLVVSANQNKYLSLNGPITSGINAIKSSESLPVVSLSNVANDRSVFGVVDRVEGGGIERTQTIGIGKVSVAKEVGDNRVIINSLGEGALWVANTNGNLVSGDYLTTSSLPGYGQKQDSDSLKNYTVAKITMDCDFSPRDLPVQIIKRNENGENDLDAYGRFQWDDDPLGATETVYKIRYLDVNGRETLEANTVHKAAFVGCTYHCG
jgi:hypothetical protein